MSYKLQNFVNTITKVLVDVLLTALRLVSKGQNKTSLMQLETHKIKNKNNV